MVPSRGSCLPLSPLDPPCLPLSPHMCACVGWCVRLPESLVSPCLLLSPTVSHCLRRCVPVLDGVSASPRVLSPLVSSCLPLSPTVSPHVCLCWMVCPPSRESCLPLSPLVSHCLPTCAPVLDGVSAFPRSCLPLLPPVSHCLPTCVPVLDGVTAFSRVLSLLVSRCLPTCVPVLDGVSAFTRVLSPLVSPCLPLSPYMCACFGWCVPLPEVLPPLVCPHVCLCWMVRPPSRGLVSLASLTSLSPSLSLFLFPFVGWCVRLPEACLPSCFPLLDGVSAFPLVSHCLPSCYPLLDGLSAFPSPCLACLPACLPACLSQVSQLKLSHAENCADCKVHRAPGLRCFQHIQFDSPMLLDSSVWIQIVAPPIGCFLHRFLAFSVATKQA